MAIYRKVYYDKFSGQVITQISFSEGYVKTTLLQDYQSNKALNSLLFDSIAVLELRFDNYDESFRRCGNNVRVDLNTLQLYFTYPTENGGTTAPTKPFEQQISDLKTENAVLKQQSTQINQDLQGLMEFVMSTLG